MVSYLDRIFCLLLVLLIVPSYTFAQDTTGDCLNPTATVKLDVNGVRTSITNGGDLWWDGENALYQVDARGDSPRQDSPNAIFCGGLWLGARDAQGEFKVAAQSYGRALGSFDYYPGPLHNGGISRFDCGDWDRIFPIYREEVRVFRAAYDPDDPPAATDLPTNIASWPGAGNPLFEELYGFSMPEYLVDMAPFEDVNQDEIYNPLDGDYPLFVGDQAVWAIFNDAGNTHWDSRTPKALKAEIHLLAYAFASEDSLLHRTTFYDYKIINRGEEELIDLYAGHWIDTDLGCYFDDRLHSAPARNLFYVYNENGKDTEVICDGLGSSYGNNAPINIYQVLRSTSAAAQLPGYRMMSSLLNAPRTFEFSPLFGWPGNEAEYYNYLTGKWHNGLPITRGGEGAGSGGDTTLYSYDGGPQEDGKPWWHCYVDQFSGTIYHVYATGPYDLAPGDAAEFTLAISTVFGVSFPDDICPDTTAIYAAADHIKGIYADSCTASVLSGTATPHLPDDVGLEVFPNPSKGSVTFRLPVTRRLVRLELIDVAGPELASFVGAGNEITIDLRRTGLSVGIYVYRLLMANGEFVAGRVVLTE